MLNRLATEHFCSNGQVAWASIIGLCGPGFCPMPGNYRDAEWAPRPQWPKDLLLVPTKSFCRWKLITSKLVQDSSACFQGANSKEKGNCLANKSIQVENSEDDTTSSYISFEKDIKNNGLMRLLSSHTEEEKETYLDKEHSSSKYSDQIDPHRTKGSLNKKKTFQPSTPRIYSRTANPHMHPQKEIIAQQSGMGNLIN